MRISNKSGEEKEITFRDVRKIVQFYYRIHREHTQVIYEKVVQYKRMLTALIYINAVSILGILGAIAYLILFK